MRYLIIITCRQLSCHGNFIKLSLRKIRQRDSSKYHVQLCIALLLMLLMTLVLVATSAEAVNLLYGGCVFISIFVHYFALVAVMWMGAEALLMFQKVVIIFVNITTKYIIILSLICWCKYVSYKLVHHTTVSFQSCMLYTLQWKAGWHLGTSQEHKNEHEGWRSM